ncbi:MAG: response regulator [Fibrobacteria bacterium]|nr:response regulator [Fibrobacteria bacterium]
MSTNGKKILVVDDEPDVVKYITSLLEDNGFETVTACNGKEGMETAIKEKPDLISLDVTMPGETGVRMLRNLSEHEATKEIPVILVTGVDFSFKSFIEQRKQVVPPKAYFEKPIDKDKLLAEVKSLLGVG